MKLKRPKLPIPPWRAERAPHPSDRSAWKVTGLMNIPPVWGDEAFCRAISSLPEVMDALEKVIVGLDMDDKFGDDIDARHEAEEEAYQSVIQVMLKMGYTEEKDS